MAVLSIMVWAFVNWEDGYSKPYMLAWNGLITMAFYMIVLELLSWLKTSHETLESRVMDGTAALREELAERRRLEKEILAVSENERQRICRDLHDNLCQHLTGVAMAAQNVEQDLRAVGNEKTADDVQRLVELLEKGIVSARDIARGLAPMHLESGELTAALEELASTTINQHGIDCSFDHDGSVRMENPASSIHLYRIAQESVTNAVRHSRARHIAIRLAELDDQVILTIKDDGCGLTDPPLATKGAGLRIMKHRASLIGAGFSIQSHPECGTIVACSLNKAFLTTHPDSHARQATSISG